MNRISSYPKVFAIGHPQVREIFSGPVIIEEKVDGSQFSMAIFDGELVCRSKGKELILDAPEKMFQEAVDVARALDLHPGWVYRCEYLKSPKHNTLSYDRIPAKHLAIFDINVGLEDYLPQAGKVHEAWRLGLDCVPFLDNGTFSSLEEFNTLLETPSFLGGCKVEGVVVKNYSLFTDDKKAMMGKYVSEQFKEAHATAWKRANPGGKDIIQNLIEMYRVESRWGKAIQHLREAGQLEESPRDIGNLIKEVVVDVQTEEEESIKEILFKHAWPQIRRGITAGLPEWYKQQLARESFPIGGE